jgi:pimeloyl-ACP methyl ester carboxylesterase
MRKVLRITAAALGTVVALSCVVAGGYVINNLNYFDWGMARVWRAGYVEKQVTINGSVMNYAEGPDNGPALLLIHGQSTDWQNYYPVLPKLAKRYHVYAVDCYGHGKSARAPEKYTNVAMGRDLQQFLVQVVGRPAIVSGHSSGGLLAAWNAAYAPEQVSGVVLEDPPVFTTLLPRAEKTWNWVDLATSAHTFLATGQTDWVSYSAEHSRMWKFFGNGKQGLLDQALTYHAQHPGRSIKWWKMPPIMNESFRAMDHYDPRFGDARSTPTPGTPDSITRPPWPPSTSPRHSSTRTGATTPTAFSWAPQTTRTPHAPARSSRASSSARWTPATASTGRSRTPSSRSWTTSRTASSARTGDS